MLSNAPIAATRAGGNRHPRTDSRSSWAVWSPPDPAVEL